MKCVVSLSGGRDSSTCLGLAVQHYGKENVFCIGFDYGSKHPQELVAAQRIADYYEVPFQIVNIDPSIFKGSKSTLLVNSEKEITLDKTYSEILKEKNGKVDTYVPARNTLFGAYILAKAESIAEEYDEDVTIILGQHADDSGYQIDEEGNEVLDYTKAAYPDTSVEYVEAFSEVARISSVGRVHYWSPFIKSHKWEIIKAGLLLEKPVPYDWCISCYEPIIDEFGDYKECGRCSTCLDSQKAEKLAREEITKMALDSLSLLEDKDEN